MGINSDVIISVSQVNDLLLPNAVIIQQSAKSIQQMCVYLCFTMKLANEPTSIHQFEKRKESKILPMHVSFYNDRLCNEAISQWTTPIASSKTYLHAYFFQWSFYNASCHFFPFVIFLSFLFFFTLNSNGSTMQFLLCVQERKKNLVHGLLYYYVLLYRLCLLFIPQK